MSTVAAWSAAAAYVDSVLGAGSKPRVFPVAGDSGIGVAPGYPRSRCSSRNPYVSSIASCHRRP